MKRSACLLLALSAAGAAEAQRAPICTDRPTKANAVCTVAPGGVQIETSALALSRTGAGEDETELFSLAPTYLRIGLGERSEVQFGLTPLARSTIEAAGATRRISGFGDILVRYKHRVSAREAPVQVGVIPFVKVPTARTGLGNGRVEAGAAVPVSFSLVGPMTMTLGPEVGLLADADGRGHHLALVNLINLSLPLAPRLTVAGELWTNVNFEPAGRVEQASADAAMAYALSNDVQVDLGANVGLTADTPDIEFYTGLSVRF